MDLLYMVVGGFVMLLLLAFPLFPFCKVWLRLKNYHLDLWMSKGPFDIWDMLAHPHLVRSFLDIVALADKDETLQQRDPELVKWCKFAREIWKMMPSSFVGQIVAAVCFLYFVCTFTGSIVGLIARFFVPQMQ